MHKIYSNFENKNLHILIFLMLVLIITISCSEKKKSVEVSSPDGYFNLLFKVDEKLGASYSVKYKGNKLLPYQV